MKIVCAIDHSTHSTFAVDAIAKLFHQSLKEVVLCHAIDARTLTQSRKLSSPQQKLATTLKGKMETLGKKTLKEMATHLELGLSQSVMKPMTVVKTRLVKGHVADSIIATAERVHPDLVVIGSRGLKDLPGYLLGSVSRQTLLHSPSSVLMVKGPIDVPVSALMAVDGSKSSRFAAILVKKWLSPQFTNLHLVSVVPEILTDIAPKLYSASHLTKLMAPARSRTKVSLGKYREFFLKEGFQVSKEMLEGNPRECILDVIEGRQSQLAILGSKGLAGVQRFTMGSVSEWIGSYAPASVLIIRK